MAEPDHKPGQSGLDDAIHKGRHCRTPGLAEEGGEGTSRGKQHLSHIVPSGEATCPAGLRKLTVRVGSIHEPSWALQKLWGTGTLQGRMWEELEKEGHKYNLICTYEA